MGSVLGALLGPRGIPEEWTVPLHNEVRSFVIGHAQNRISDLAAQTRAVARAVAAEAAT